MIVAPTDNRHENLAGPSWDRAFAFLAGLDRDTAEGRYPLDGDALFAVVESYATRPAQSALPEAHRRYIDIQALLAGAEQIAWWPTSDLSTSTPYDEVKDIEFFDRPDVTASTITLVPGRFALFFPGDAHMPCLRIGPDPARVKKVVIKVRIP